MEFICRKLEMLLLLSFFITKGPAMKYPVTAPFSIRGKAMLDSPALQKKIYGSPSPEEKLPAKFRRLLHLLLDLE